MHRELLPTYALVGGCALIGLLVTVFVVEYEPRVLMWAFGAGAGLMFGAFVAAIASNEPLAGGSSRPEPLFSPHPTTSGAGPSMNGHGGTNGRSASDYQGVTEGEEDESLPDGGRYG